MEELFSSDELKDGMPQLQQIHDNDELHRAL